MPHPHGKIKVDYKLLKVIIELPYVTKGLSIRQGGFNHKKQNYQMNTPRRQGLFIKINLLKNCWY